MSQKHEFDLTKVISQIPKFCEYEVDAYFVAYFGWENTSDSAFREQYMNATWNVLSRGVCTPF